MAPGEVMDTRTSGWDRSGGVEELGDLVWTMLKLDDLIYNACQGQDHFCDLACP